MSKATLSQGHQLLNLVAQSGIKRDGLQALLGSGRFSDLLREFTEEEAHKKLVHPEPIITPIRVLIDYSRPLVVMRDAGQYDGCVASELNDDNYPVDAQKPSDCDLYDAFVGERRLFLVCFNREIGDSEDPAESELLRELDKLGLTPEGPPELCAIGEYHPELQREFPIVARRQVWRSPDGDFLCPILGELVHERNLVLDDFRGGWPGDYRFLASRK